MLSQDPHTYNSRNKKSIKDFIDELFSKHAKLLPVRIDLSYKMNQTIAKEFNHTGDLDYLHNSNLAPHAYLTREDIIFNWNKLLDKLRWNTRAFLAELVGYAWKIEYGNEKGMHYHIMLFFNGNRAQKDFYYADTLGQLWLEITQGQGLYFNCSIDKVYRYGNHNGLKVTHRNDDRTNIYQTAKYLAKIDVNEDKARNYSYGRLFGKSGA
ncbi:inovirus-type Gp2 protein [Orbus wheelerorum]|uniref:YagK/YfjJ domain-containing protein n=1 Tax=Orbus wheelerorum TaxID=3074111 RepID=UPI00370DA692